MITAALRGQRYGVYGLARTGRSVLAFLRRSGADAVAWDADPAARAGTEAEIADLDTVDLAGLTALVVSPGVPLNTHPIAARARAAHVPVIGDIELFARARPALPAHKVVGITGTNGKSTTTALVHHILVSAGVPSLMGGNIGLPILDQPALSAGGVYVLELSSYQIDLTQSLDCDVAVILNVTPDHLERYGGDIRAYAAAKARLLAMQSAGHTAIVASDDAFTRAMGNGDAVRVHAADVADQSGWPALQGPHNAQNVAAACAVARALGLNDDSVQRALQTYPGLPHRMQVVGTRGGVRYVNDSKATNAASTLPALSAYERLHWIAGGRAKPGDDYAPLAAQARHLRAAYLIGEAAPLLAAALAGRVPVVDSETMPAAVARAAAAAQPGDTVLLSPACASFDQFTDFEARGRAFIAAVEELPS